MFTVVLVVTIIVFIPTAYLIMQPVIPWLFQLPSANASH
jgi:hypothetical protein